MKTRGELVIISQNFLSLSDLVAVDSVDSSVETQESLVETGETPNIAEYSPLTTVILTFLVLVLLLIFVMALFGLLLRKKKS